MGIERQFADLLYVHGIPYRHGDRSPVDINRLYNGHGEISCCWMIARGNVTM